MQMTRKMTAVTEAMITMVWEFMLTAVLLGGSAWVVLEGGKHPAAVEVVHENWDEAGVQSWQELMGLLVPAA